MLDLILPTNIDHNLFEFEEFKISDIFISLLISQVKQHHYIFKNFVKEFEGFTNFQKDIKFQDFL